MTAPSLYHHFGDKAVLLEALTEEAFAAYLKRKHAVPRTGDLLVDFAAAWDMHISFGVENPVLYALMYGRDRRSRSRAAQMAESELRRGLEQIARAGLLRTGIDEAVAMTTAMAIGCVTRLIRDGGSAAGPLARSMCAALIPEITGHSPDRNDAGQAARFLLALLGSAPRLFTSAEEALLRQWLRAVAGHCERISGEADRSAAAPELQQGE